MSYVNGGWLIGLVNAPAGQASHTSC
jgi:hypothetical protein